MKVRMYRVGGCVRDELLGVRSKDVDYAVEAESFDAMREEIVRRGGQIFLEKPEYYTIRAKVPNSLPADFALCRKDGVYTDGRRPDSVEPATLLDDLSRRDFTMNAIAVSEEGEYIDPFDGRGDIERRLIRCVGHARDRFNEDSLRMLRAIRFSITKGFNIDHEVELCFYDKDLLKKLRCVSEDRIRDELTKCFAKDTLKTLNLLNEYNGIMAECFSGNLWLKPTNEQP